MTKLNAYTVFQPVYDAMSREEWLDITTGSRWLNVTATEELRIDKFESKYSPECMLFAPDHDSVIHMMNVWPEEPANASYMAKADTWRSASVGDIIVNNATGEAVIIAMFGFNEINLK